MSEQDKELAQESAELAARQAGYAASNVAEAAEHAKDYAVELIAFNFRTHSKPVAIVSAVVASTVGGLAVYGARELYKNVRYRKRRANINYAGVDDARKETP